MDRFVLKKKRWNPYSCSVSCDKIENNRLFDLLDARFWSKKVYKNLRPGGQRLFSPKHPD